MKKKVDFMAVGAFLILGILFVAAIFQSNENKTKALGDCEYEVILPISYEESDVSYPVVYVLPQDGYHMDDSGLAEDLSAAMEAEIGTEMILVKVAFTEDAVPAEVMKSLIGAIDDSYRTIPEKACRVMAGTGVGGYLAYGIALEEQNMVGGLVSIRGDFASEENPWIATYGNVSDTIKGMQDFHMNFFEENYTYLDAPVTDIWTNMEGSTNDIGAMFIEMGVGSSSHEFTVRTGEFTEEFMQESSNRVVDRLTAFMAEHASEGALALPEDENAASLAPVLVSADAAEVDGEYQKLDLAGSWYFEYRGSNQIVEIDKLEASEYQQWSVVEPGTGNWTKGYGNISEENVDDSYGEDYFDYFIIGNAYYVKEFELPETFNSKEMVLSIGYVDDRCEVFVNGERVGLTGMDPDLSLPTGETTWAEYSSFEFDGSILKYDDVNTIIVRAYNDGPYGGGGWYEGPIYLASKAAEAGNAQGVKQDKYFYEETFDSSYAAAALKQSGSVSNPYLIYLPKDYYESDESYPTLYLLHQFNSDHTSYQTDDINVIMDEAIASGALDEMIVVIPNSDENSWWTGDWEKMIIEELIPHIDSNYRTIPDAEHRITAGCSMGGQGAFSVALKNPEYFSGAASFFGALSMPAVPEDDVLAIAEKESKEYLEQFSWYFICGNQDVYGFGVPAIELAQILEDKGVEYEFFIENGGHDSKFYVPHFVEGIAYISEHMK